MAIAVVERANFSAGQIDGAARRDRQKTIFVAGCSVARNMRILNGGGQKRRPGLWRRATLVGQSVGIEFVTDAGAVFKLIFSNARLDIYDTSNALVQTITSLAWGTSILGELYLDRSLGKMIVSHQTFWPKVISVTAAGVWSVSDFVFDDAFSGGPAQPYYRYADKGMTLQPSALTGSVTLSLSGAGAFNASHVGAYFRYIGFPIQITGYSSANSATGTVVGALPPTVHFTVDNASNFAVDEEAEGLDSGAKGIITGISGSTITFVYASNFNGLAKDETLIGDSSKAQAKLTTAPVATTPAAVVDWDEQAFSAVRGYPGCGVTHRGRLYFANMRDLPRGVTASAAGLPNYFLIGANDGDAFFELVPDFKGQRVRHIMTADQGLVLTDKAAYYLAEYSNQPVTPSTIDFKFIGPIGASKARPIATEQGFAFIENGANRVIGILPTGSVQQPWQAQDLSPFWTELLTGPVALGSNIATTSFPERYGFAINTDGTLACVKYQDPNAPVPIGWTPWDTANGLFSAVFPADGKLWAIVHRTSPAAWTLEEFDDALYLDCAQTYTYVSGIPNVPFYASTTVKVMDGTSPWWLRGTFAVNGSGNFTAWNLAAGNYILGYDMTTQFRPTPPAPSEPAFRFGERFGIVRLYLRTENTGAYMINGQTNAAYRAGEDTNAAPPLRNEWKRWKIPGRSANLAPNINQSTPGPLQISEITMEVSF